MSFVGFLCPYHPAQWVTVCPHRGRGELGSEDQKRQMESRVVLLDLLGFGPATLLGFGFCPSNFFSWIVEKSRILWWRGPQGVGSGRKGFPAALPSHGSRVPLQPKKLLTRQRTGQVHRVDNVIWVPSKVFARSTPARGLYEPGWWTIFPVYLFQLPDSRFGNFSTHCPGKAPA